MRMRLIVAGKPALAYAKAGVDEYLKRLSRFGSYELVTVKAGTSEEVSARLLERSDGCFAFSSHLSARTRAARIAGTTLPRRIAAKRLALPPRLTMVACHLAGVS
jgi:23S rRNA pseudoU1915 N3-methylase RlmH